MTKLVCGTAFVWWFHRQLSGGILSGGFINAPSKPDGLRFCKCALVVIFGRIGKLCVLISSLYFECCSVHTQLKAME
jgi:hypothetical protein